MKWSAFKTVVDNLLKNEDPEIDLIDGLVLDELYIHFVKPTLGITITEGVNGDISAKITNKYTGIYSKDPDNDPHNWPEYTTNENGDECSKCISCNVDFFGYRSRTLCYKCAFTGSYTHGTRKRNS